MAKCSPLGRLLQLRISTCAALALAVFTLCEFFASYGIYNYTHTPRDTIATRLYKKVNPKLLQKHPKPDCTYNHILRNEHSINSWEIPKKFDDFSVRGLVNGSYVPPECSPLYSVALLVTYRDRQRQLDVFLPYMHNFLRKQNIHYKIYLIEQQDEKPWNKGLLYNVGARRAMADGFPCLVLHDVDLLPLAAGNLYACLPQPRHLSASIDKFRFVLPYDELSGGVLSLLAEQYAELNGFSNRFLGWGGEDDDFSARIAARGLDIQRFPRELSRYSMLPHAPVPPSPERRRVLADNARRAGAAADGLDSVRYTAVLVKPHRLFTLVGVRL